MNRVGEQLGNYRLIRLLGQGGSAEVYLAEHIFLKTLAAIKVLSVRLTSKDLEHFLNEARIIASLDHPNIIRILEFGVEGGKSLTDTGDLDGTGGTPFLVMEYARNGTLRTRFPRGTRVPLEAILTCVRQAADALQYAHDRRLIHRDIKPENMLLGRNNEVLITDFGIAVVTQNSLIERTQEVAGTIGYMAPEQLQGKPRPASDQYALGVIIYEWLCGDRPFSGSFIDLFSQHLQTPPPPLRLKIPGIPPEVEAVVMKTLAKDWQERFANIKLFASTLEQVCRPYVSPFSSSSPAVQTTFTLPPSPSFLPFPMPGSVGGTGMAATSPTTTPPSSTTPVTPPLVEPMSMPGVSMAGTILPNTSHSPATAASSPSLNKAVHQAGMAPPVSGMTGTAQLEARTPRKRRISRRAVLAGLGIAGVTAAGSITAWLILSQNQKPSSQTHTPSPSVSIQLVETLLTYRGHSQAIYGLKWSPDGSHIASVSLDKTVQVWDATTGTRILNYTRHTASTNGVAWLPHSGARIASASADKTVQIWDAITGDHILTYSGHTDNVRSVTWSPDGKYIASAGNDATVKVWDATTGHTLFSYTGHKDFIWNLAWSPDGTRIASASEDTTVQVFDAVTGMHVLTYHNHRKGVQALTWSPDSRRIASASQDTTVQIWDTSVGRTLLTYHGHTDTVQGVAWSPNSKYMASCSSNAQIWDTSSGENIGIYNNQPPLIHGLAWSPNSIRIASAGEDATARVWQAR